MICIYKLTLFFVIVYASAEDDLKAVNLMYRHGDRMVNHFYPNDPYKDSSLWTTPFGELTNIGKNQHYQLGKWLRNRYDGFLTQIYNKSEIYIRSTDRDRVLMSAACNLAGLYPPQEKDIWNKDLLWQPIPIHTMPVQDENVLLCCPNYVKLLQEAQTLPYYQKINEENKQLYEYLTEKSGLTINNLDDVYTIYDILYVEQVHNFTLPDWARGVFSKMAELVNIQFTIATCTTQLSRLYNADFFYNLITQLKSFSKHHLLTSDDDTKKFMVYSNHDSQIFGILDALKIPNLERAPYAAALIFELRKTAEEYYVQILYKTKVDVADVIQIEGCEPQCELNKFINITSSLFLTKQEFHDECYN